MVTKCSFRHNLTEDAKQKTYLTKLVKEYSAYNGNAMYTTNYGIIWSQNVHFDTTLMKPLNKKLIVTAQPNLNLT